MSDANALHAAIGDPVLTGHTNGVDGHYVKLRYDTVAETYRAFEALSKLINRRAEWRPGSTPAVPSDGPNK